MGTKRNEPQHETRGCTTPCARRASRRSQADHRRRPLSPRPPSMTTEPIEVCCRARDINNRPGGRAFASTFARRHAKLQASTVSFQGRSTARLTKQLAQVLRMFGVSLCFVYYACVRSPDEQSNWHKHLVYGMCKLVSPLLSLCSCEALMSSGHPGLP